ncbi:hypothetical protein HJG60_009751 [Phyllostomus discolor]|uniref:Uncharacterized protein n=1 Tax=Phyllostomus discolor TaxID=89673 RepID=A0A834ELA3_9CHIR|nr:hypothetical protein HJG60_009751 [Phyllostomus discolor]
MEKRRARSSPEKFPFPFPFFLYLMVYVSKLVIVLFFNYLTLLYFSHYHLIPLYHLPRSNHHTVVRESFFLFAQSFYPLPSALPLAVILLSIYDCPHFPCLFISFHMHEIIRYLSFSDWLILLSRIFSPSRSIHAVAKGKIFFFFMVK